MAKPESSFPTIIDLRDQLDALVMQGLGDLPVQVVVAPDSTMQAIARATEGAGYSESRPALMIDLVSDKPTGRLPVTLISTERLGGESGMPSIATQ